MPKNKQINKVLVIGSGPIVIGQAAEFDYAGTQACLTLKQEGCEVILINNNPATIMTDDHIADKVYFEPLTVANVEAIIKKEKPDGLLATVSGQTGLNLAFSLEEKQILQQYDVEVLGTSIDSIMKGEDRDKFRSLMQEIEEPIPESAIVESLEEALAFSEAVAFPIIIRPAYTLGGSGGGIANNETEFIKYVTSGLRASPIHQCLIEKSIAGWKEIEFEVICDQKGQAVVVCHMENIDPVGVHTGDSVVVAPIQTLDTEEVELLRTASLHIVQELGIVGACNVQLGYDAVTRTYKVIEVNPRVSRSSALASKATGYPIAKIATKLSLGYTLDELYHAKQQMNLATYEPQLDYTVVKFPCWPFDKLTTADRQLGTQMKATGEVMAIEKTVAAGLQKAIRSLELNMDGARLKELKEQKTAELENMLDIVDDRRMFAVLELLHRDVTVEELHEKTSITSYFLQELKKIADLEKAALAMELPIVSESTLLALKQAGFTNTWLAEAWGVSLEEVAASLTKAGIHVQYDAIEAYASQETTDAAYYYAVWEKTETPVIAAEQQEKEKVLIIGSGPIRIGQGVEFDYCSVKGIEALQKYGYETILINNNPATVSTDYELADKLYMEPITTEDVLHVMAYENIEKVIVQFGGQTAINLIEGLEAAGVTFMGSSMNTIDMLEDRERFYAYVNEIGVPHIPGYTAESEQDLYQKADKIGYPVLIRPSYVIGGKGMAIMEDEADLAAYMAAQLTATSYPILIDAYYPGKEVEVDVVTDGNSIFIPAIFEHIEKAGVHSGDSMAVTPPISLTAKQKEKVVLYAEKVAQGMSFKGIFNIQFVLHEDVLYVLEVNPRASRTVPVVSKVTGVDMIELATAALLGKALDPLHKHGKLLPENDFYTMKAPIFSTAKLPNVDPKLVPEMKSTGEVIALAPTLSGCKTKAFLWNEQLANEFEREDKEVLLETVEEVCFPSETALQQLGMTVVYKDNQTAEDLETWMKSEKAFALYSKDVNSQVRERATECHLIVMSAEETLEAFCDMTNEKLQVEAIQNKQLAYEKEVVLQ